MQPGSGGTYNDVIRSEGAEPSPAPVDRAQLPADVNVEPKATPAPHGKP